MLGQKKCLICVIVLTSFTSMSKMVLTYGTQMTVHYSRSPLAQYNLLKNDRMHLRDLSDQHQKFATSIKQILIDLLFTAGHKRYWHVNIWLPTIENLLLTSTKWKQCMSKLLDSIYRASTLDFIVVAVLMFNSTECFARSIHLSNVASSLSVTGISQSWYHP